MIASSMNFNLQFNRDALHHKHMRYSWRHPLTVSLIMAKGIRVHTSKSVHIYSVFYLCNNQVHLPRRSPIVVLDVVVHKNERD